jgi:excisionase family DNA binding protein
MGIMEQILESLHQIQLRLDNLEKLIQEKSTTQESEQFLDIKEAAQLLRLSPPTIYGLVNKRAIPHNKKGKRLYFLKSELLQWLKDGRRKTIKEIKSQL